MRMGLAVLTLSSLFVLACATRQPSSTASVAPEAQPAPSAPITASPQAPTHASHIETPKISAEKALSWLKNGNTRFRKGALRKDGQSRRDVGRLSSGQTPHTIVLSCSDSRVPPEIVFDQKLGEIFVVRNAGEIPDSASIASIEYAVEHLGPQLLLVMGHTSCGAVKAALSTLEGADAGSPALNSLVHDIHPRLMSFKGKTPSPEVENEAWANAKGIAEDLLARSTILQKKVTSGQLRIQAALYHLDDGKVEFAP
jgi:carbonic anhydrase